MDSLEFYFRSEMEYLHQRGIDASKNHSNLASFLANSNDPDVERLLSGFAFLTGGLKKKIEDGVPEITHHLLEKIWPAPLRPIPATSIARFYSDSIDTIYTQYGSCDISAASQVYTQSDTHRINFNTVHDLHIEPITLEKKSLVREPDRNEITLSFLYHGSTPTWKGGEISLFLGTERESASLLNLWISIYLDKTYITINNTKKIINSVIKTFSHSSKSVIQPLQNERFWPLHPLIEYFYHPHIHNFVTLDLSLEHRGINFEKDKRFDITFSFSKLLPINSIEHAFIPHCVPIINIDKCQTPKITPPLESNTCKLTQHHVYKILSIQAIQEPDIQSTGELIQFQSVLATHATTFKADIENPHHYLFLSHNETDISDRPQCQINFYHANGEKLQTQLPPIVCQYLSWSPNASSVSVNKIINTSENIPHELAVTNITPCSNSYFGVISSHQHWRLLSLLSLNYLALRQVETLKELLRLFDFHPSNISQSNIIQRCIDGIVSIDTKPLDWLVKGSLHRGIAITLTLDPACYPNLGEMYQFAVALCCALSISQSTNSFIHMDAINQQTNEQWHIGHVQGHHPML